MSTSAEQSSIVEMGLYDRPHIISPNQQESGHHKRLQISYESDPTNVGLVTNPFAMWKMLRIDHFSQLEDNQQGKVLEILITTLKRSPNNCHLLSDCNQASQSQYRMNKALVTQLQSGKLPDLKEVSGCPQDILVQLILIGLNYDYSQVYQAMQLLGSGSQNFERYHIELIYQHVRIDSSKFLSRALNILNALFEHQTLPQSYFYFNGFLSGILLKQQTTQMWPFSKGFAACIWFNISSLMIEGKMQDPQNLPVLFNCYSSGFGGFECYFNQNRLLYRILPPIPYQAPTVDSNGFLISEFPADKWNYLAIEHDKPFLARAQLIAVVNDKQVVSFSMDYPKFDKSSKLTQVCICNNFTGQMSNFILFKEQVNNSQKFVQIFKQHQPDFRQLDSNIFEQRLQEKILLLYSPTRTSGKIIYDFIDMNDGELLINCGVWGAIQANRRPLIQEQAGIKSLLVLLEKCTEVHQVNQFLRVLQFVMAQSGHHPESDCYRLLFILLQRLPRDAVDTQTVKLLTELSVTIQDSAQSEVFFKALMTSADFWLSTENFEVLQEYWNFVKSIYSTNPVQNNLIFPIHNLIYLMVKISEDKSHFCCPYHFKTHEIFYGQSDGQPEQPVQNVDKFLEPIAAVLECVLTSGGDDILSSVDQITHSLALKSCPCYHIQILKLLKVVLIDSRSHHECASPIDFAQRFLNANGLQILLYLCANNAELDVKSMCIKLIDVLSSHTSLIQMRIDTDLITYLSHVLLPSNMSRSFLQAQRNDKPQESTAQADDIMPSPQKGAGFKFFAYKEAVFEETEQLFNASAGRGHNNSDSFEMVDDEKLLEKEVLSKTHNNFATKKIQLMASDDEEAAGEMEDKSGSREPSDQHLSDNHKSEGQQSDEEAEVEDDLDAFIPPPAPKTSKQKTGFQFGGLGDLDSASGNNENSGGSEHNSHRSEAERSNKSEEEVGPILKLEKKKFQPPAFSKPKGLGMLTLQDDNSELPEFKAPPSKTEFMKKFGAQLLDGLGSDDEIDLETQRKKDEEAPKPTVDVLMSRNLRSGANKGFNFGGFADSDSEDNSNDDLAPAKQTPALATPTEESKEDGDEFVLAKPNKNKFAPPSFGRKKNLALNTGEVDDDKKESPTNNDDFLSLPSKKTQPAPAKKGKALPQLSIDAEQTIVGASGGTNDHDDEAQIVLQPPPRIKPGPKPALGLTLDTEKINDLFTFGGEKGELKEEQALEKFEEDITELALICVTAMRRKKIPRPEESSEFQMLLQKSEQSIDKHSEQNLLNTNHKVKGIKNLDQKSLTLPDVLEEESSYLQDNEPSQLNQTGMSGFQLTKTLPDLLQSQTSDDYTGELENLYTSCLEWILNRAPSGLFKTMMVDDYDKITFLPAMNVLMHLVSRANNMIRQRALQDMFMLAQWDSSNGQLLLQHKSFHSWLLELLTPYELERQSDSAKAVYDMGSKLHTLLLKNSCTYPEEDDAFKKINLLTRWPTIIAERGFDAQGAHELTRQLIINLTTTLTSQNVRQVSKNLSHLTLQAHELILTSSEGKSQTQSVYSQNNNDSLLKWVLTSHLRIIYDDETESYLWRDLALATHIVQGWDSFFIGTKMTDDAQDLEKTVRNLLFSKGQDELNQIVELLMQSDQTANSPSAEQIQAQRSSYSTRLLQLGGFGRPSKSQDKKVSVLILQAIVNLVCLSLTQSNIQNDRQLCKKWISRLELYFKHTVMVSELWRPKSPEDQLYQKYQRKIAEICSFILAFLFQEIHTTRTPKNANSSSPQSDNMQRRKTFENCLKSCMIFMINMAGMQQDQGTGNKAVSVILQQILVKQYSNQQRPLIGHSDIARLIESNFEEFPECFYQNDWKITFFHNSLINTCITSQLSLDMIDGFKRKRLLYAVRLRDAETSTMQANEEILRKIQADNVQAISDVTHKEYDSKNGSALRLDFIQRECLVTLNSWVKQVSGNSRGAWYQQPAKVFQKMHSQTFSEGQKCLLTDVSSNQFSLLDNARELEKSLLNEVYPAQQFMSLKSESQNSSFVFFTKLLGSQKLAELAPVQRTLLCETLVEGMKPARKLILECDQVAVLKALERRPCSLVLTNFELVLIYDTVAQKSDSTIFFFQWKVGMKLTKTVSLSDVREIQKRRFLGQNKAIELFLKSRKSILIDFKDAEQRDQFAKKLLRQRQTKCKNLVYYTSLDPRIILKKTQLTDDWVNHRISNFKYLMSLNQLASRSYHDLSQYPVFPWVLSQLKSAQPPDLLALNTRGGAPPGHFRDLMKNMQLLGSAERQAEFKRKYEDFDGFDGLDDRFHCGSHYSNPGIVLHYLVRVQPIVEANIVLQSNALDHPDRIFNSIHQSLQHALQNMGDMRELVPEFYCLPEMFVNSNCINFGKKEDGTRPNDVQLPEWCKKNSQLFVQVMREAFESPYVSQNLNSWIDYIFGYKQRGSDAINCLNTFSKITYQNDLPGDFDINSVQNQEMRAALQNQGYNFGQTPLQLFKERHPQRNQPLASLKGNLVVDEVSKLKIFKPVQFNQVGPKTTNSQSSYITSEAIMYAKFIDNTRIVGAKRDGYAQNFVWLPRAHDQNPQISFSLGSDRLQKFNGREFDKGVDQVDRSTKRLDYPMIITKDGNYVVKGGFWDGKVVFCPIESNSLYPQNPPQLFELNDHKTTVCALAVDSNEETLITGSKTGEVIVWRNALFDCQLEAPSQHNPWVNLRQLNDHERQVTSIFIQEEMCLFITSSTDGNVNMYNLWTAAFLRTFSHPAQLSVHSAILAQNPLPMCGFFSRDDHYWHAYTINGAPIINADSEKKTRFEEASHVVSPLVIKSTNQIDKLVYGTEKGIIFMRHLPSLERFRRLQVAKDYPVLSLLVSPDRRFLLTGCGDGGLIVITERGEQQQVSQNQQLFTPSTQQRTQRSNQSNLNQTISSNQSGFLNSIQSFVSGRQSPAMAPHSQQHQRE